VSGGEQPPPPSWPQTPPWPSATGSPGPEAWLPPGAGARGWAPPEPPPRGRYRWVAVILVLLAVIAIAVVGAVVWFVSALRPPVDAMNDYLSAVSRGDYAAAYNMLCTDKRDTTSYEQFRVVTANFATGLTEYNVWSFDPFGSRRTVQYNFTRANTKSRTHRATIVREHGAWKVCSFYDQSRANE
jgi:uncharacterized protein YxeA